VKVERLLEKGSPPKLGGYVVFWVVEGMSEKGFFSKEYDVMFTSGERNDISISRSPESGLYIRIPNKIDLLRDLPAVVTTGEWERIEASVEDYNSEV